MKYNVLKVKKRESYLMLVLKKLSLMQYFASALISSTVLFFSFIVFPDGYQTSIMLLVNDKEAGAGNPVPLSIHETETPSLNNKLKNQISALADGVRNLTIEPGEVYHNSIVLKVITKSPVEGTEVLHEIIDSYNKTHSRYTTANDSRHIDDSIKLIKSQLKSINTMAKTSNIPVEPTRILKVLEALSYYVKQPVNQFAQLPNTFDVNDAKITQLIEKYNLLQTDRQRILTEGEEGENELLKISRQLLTVQQNLNTAIVTQRNALINRGSKIKTQAPDNKAKNELLLTYRHLLKEKNTKAKKSVVALSSTGLPEIVIVRRPYLMICILSLIAGIFLPFLFHQIIAKMKQMNTITN